MTESYSPNTIVNVRSDIENMVSSRQVPSDDPSLVDNNDCLPRHRQTQNLRARANSQQWVTGLEIKNCTVFSPNRAVTATDLSGKNYRRNSVRLVGRGGTLEREVVGSVVRP